MITSEIMTLFIWIYGIAFFIVFIVVNGLVANQKGRNVFAIVWTSILFSPLLIYLYLLAVPAIENEYDEDYEDNGANKDDEDDKVTFW